MLGKIAGILTVATIATASVAFAHPVHYAMAVAGQETASLALPAKAYTGLAGDRKAARKAALAQCREATGGDCVVIGGGALPHDH